jgi:hypothetical protein
VVATNSPLPTLPDFSRIVDGIQQAVRAINNLSTTVTKTRAYSTANPANPTGTTSSSGKMMGLGAAVTPQSSGVILFLANGDLLTGAGGKAQLRYGTGTAPANGAAPAGTAIGGNVEIGSSVVPFALLGLAAGLSVGTAYWFDIELASNGGTAAIADLGLVAIEI